jgi:nitrous oxidase accessory protein NosD
MGGDYTRFTFDPVKEFSGVRKQQGRVSLDADFNEFEAILDRQRRAGMHDTVGSAGRAVVPATTPDGFKIGLAGTQLSIGVGRAYVDGILAECFGDMAPGKTIARDDVLGGVRGAAALPFDKQPFYYSGFPGLLPGGGINTVYLDVWQREVTVFEDEALREPALNGPDTATRMQTAWQVKVMSQPATSSNCSVTPPGWAALTAASTARLTAKADGVLAPPPGPCEINPAGGYTGLENRLYRVEVHSSGTLGGTPRATFKWSRDNASIAARVTDVKKVGTQWTITVSSTGPDGWSRFDDGDHLELIDDDIEFAMREKGVGGLMMKVVSADHANDVLTVDANLSGFTLHPDRHPRIRRWDRPAGSSTEPLLRDASPTGDHTIEDGIKITFNGAAGDTLRAGDYWVFEARTATGAIGRLVNAPPRGPLHHFAKLAYVTVGQQPTDCRVFWPPVFTAASGEGCCTKVVKPGEDIQAAIGALAGKGGCVCLKMGVHTITQPLQITEDNITLHAEAPLVTVRMDGAGPHMLSIMGARHVNVLGILFQAGDGSKGGAMVELDGVRDGRIADCAFGFSNTSSTQGWNTLGMRLEGCRDYAIENNAFDHFTAGIKGQECDRLKIIGNQFTAPTVEQTNGPWSAGTMGIVFTDTVGIEVSHNRLSHYRRAIMIGDFAAGTTPLDLAAVTFGCRIAGNVITRRGGSGVDNIPPPTARGAGTGSAIAFAIAARMPRCEILENAIHLDVTSDAGILADCGNVLIARNLLSSTAALSIAGGVIVAPRGVVAAVREDDALACVIGDNLFAGLQQAVLVAGTPESSSAVRRVEVISNHVAGSAELLKSVAAAAGNVSTSPQALLMQLGYLSAILINGVRGARVADNELANTICAVTCVDAAEVTMAGNAISGGLAGVVLANASACDVADNIVDQVILGIVTLVTRLSVVQRNVLTQTKNAVVDLMSSDLRIEHNDITGGTTGIEVVATGSGELHGNTVQDTTSAGVLALVPLKNLTLSHNTVRRCGYRATTSTSVSASGIGVYSLDAAVLVESCQAIDIGVSADTTHTPFMGARFGIVIGSQHGRARVHGCTITSPSISKKDNGPGANPESRALLIKAGEPKKPTRRNYTEDIDHDKIESADNNGSIDYADACDNLAEQTATPVVEIVIDGEVIFSDNRCRRLDSDPGKGPVVSLAGECIAAHGNRVRAQGGGPSLALMASRSLTAVGNMTTTDADITGVPPVPAPYRQFNART